MIIFYSTCTIFLLFLLIILFMCGSFLQIGFDKIVILGQKLRVYSLVNSHPIVYKVKKKLWIITLSIVSSFN